MKISVVIPAYNEEKLILLTLQALNIQTRKPDEIIVVNASSTDKTKEIAEKEGASVLNAPKLTIGYSRQKGLQKAAGDIIAFTDADATPPPDWLERIERYLTKPGVVGYFGGFRVPDGPWWYKIYVNIFQPFFNSLLFFLFRMPMATGQNMAFWREKAIAVGGFPEHFKIAEDIEIARRLMTVGKIVFTQSEYVRASGRRGNEGIGLLLRIPKVFFNYFIWRKANVVGFPDIRE